jgi:hypothetical protein
VTRDSVVASAGTPTPAPPGPTVSLFDYRFTLPSGFVVGHRSGVVDLATADPHAGIGGYTDSFSARDPATGRGLQATVYRGPIAAAERQVEYPVPGEVHETTVAGHPTSVDPFGTDRECVWRDVTPASPRPGEESTIRGTCADGKWVEGRKGSIEARVHVSAREEILVHAVDIPEAELLALLEAALQGS